MHPALSPARGTRRCVGCRPGHAAGQSPQSPGDEWQQEPARDKRPGGEKKDETGGGSGEQSRATGVPPLP